MGERDGEKTSGENEDDTNRKLFGLVTYYMDNATIHGVSRVGERGLYSYRRLVWLLLLLVMFVGLTTLMYLHFQRYSQHPTVTVVSARVTDVLPFPAVTICNLNQFHMRRIPRDPRLRKLLYRMSDFAHVREYMESMKAEEYDPLRINTGEDLWEFAMNASHRLTDLLILCVYSLARIPCEQVFRPTLTDLGTCYTFNGDWDVPRRNVTDSGSLRGLRIILNIEQDAYYYSLYSQSGVKVVLHEPGEAPIMLNRGFFVRPGTCTDVAIRREQSAFLPAPYKAFGESFCLDTDDAHFRSPLTRYQNYSYSRLACLRDCYIGRLVNECGCRHFFEHGDEKYCTIDELESCYLPHQEEISMEDLHHCTCPSPCTETGYVTSMSFTDFASNFIVKKMFNSNFTADRDFVRDNLIELRLYYDTLTVTENRQEAEMTAMDILGTMGGHMGFFLGASVLSVSEVLEVILLVVFGCLLGRGGSRRHRTDHRSPATRKISKNMEQADSPL